MSRNRPDLRWAHDLARMSQVSLVAYVSGGSFVSIAYWDFFWTIMAIVAATHALVCREYVKRPCIAPARVGCPRVGLFSRGGDRARRCRMNTYGSSHCWSASAG
jgi:hypothetical protein